MQSIQETKVLINLTRTSKFFRHGPIPTKSHAFTRSLVTSKRAKDFKSVKYWTEDRVAHVMLNRPERLNAIDHHMPFEIQIAIQMANWDETVHAILLYGAGEAFCSGYDLKSFAEEEDKDASESDPGDIPRYSNQEMPWDPSIDFMFMNCCTQAYMEIWRSMKPVVGKIQRVAIGGGSDIALACDVTFIESKARIGYPPSVIWGCPTSAFWFYRLGMEKAKRILFTGEILSGDKAAAIGLIGESCSGPVELDKAVNTFLERVVTVPKNQLWYQKQVVNHAVENLGLYSTQRLATIFDGMSRHSPEGVAFQHRCLEVGFKQAVGERDSGKETVWSHMVKGNRKE